MFDKGKTITRCVSHLSDKMVRELMQKQAMEFLYLPNRPETKFTDVEELRDFVLKTIGNVSLTYLEFGVASGASLRSVMHRFTHPTSKFFGFDSFEGLPESWNPHLQASFPKGTFTQGGDMPFVDDSRAEIVKGLFQNTLPQFSATGAIGGPRPHLVHYDADLYSSTLFVLSTLWHILPEYFFVMDEFPYDEVVALRDFVQSYPVAVTFLAEAGDKMFGWMRRVPLSL